MSQRGRPRKISIPNLLCGKPEGLVLSEAQLIKNYTDTYYPDYPPDTLLKMKDQIFIQSDRVAVLTQAKRFAEWLLSKREGDTITLGNGDIKLLESILTRELKNNKAVKFNPEIEGEDALGQE